jgi:uncharacterized membrane protein
MGAFVDGILLHQILQWHNLLSSVRPPKDLVDLKYNMVWDGVFHALSWSMVAVGLFRLWRAGKRSDVDWSGRAFVGALVLGWGLFNGIEGVIDHQLLGLHHVHPGQSQLAWDVAFLLFAAAQIAVGTVLIRAARKVRTEVPGLPGRA